MATYAVDSKRQAMTATGIVNLVQVWETTSEGRRKTDEQAHHEDTGMPLWDVEVRYVTQVFGDSATVVHKVTVGHQTKPEVQPDTPVTFDGLYVDANVNRHKTFTERWRAETLADFVPMAGDAKNGARVAATPKEKAA